MQKEIQISIICLAYNHEKYIRQCLDGFVMQETDLAFEAIVHDDASTDGTAAIVREYAERYPDIIKPILQTENQYSQKIPIILTHVLPRTSGKYLAWCEGDDYWTDPHKLQKQYEFLSSHPEYSMCVHRALWRELGEGEDHIFPAWEEDRDVSLDEIIQGGGGIFATNSLVIRREAYVGMPDCFRAQGFGDYQLFMYGAMNGRCRCLRDVMSVYDHGTENSWSARTAAAGEAAVIRVDKEICRMLRAVDGYYDRRYHEPIERVLRRKEYDLALREEDFREAMRPRYRSERRRHTLTFKMYILLRAYFPGLYALLKKIFHGQDEQKSIR